MVFCKKLNILMMNIFFYFYMLLRFIRKHKPVFLHKNQPNPLIIIPNSLLPYGLPVSEKNLYIIYRNGYVCGYDHQYRIPKWVCWTNYYNNINKLDVPRYNCFENDDSISVSANPEEFHKSGFDMGHLCPCEDMSYSSLTQRESFIMTNIVPQYPHFNRVIWSRLEDHCRDIVRDNKSDYWNIVIPIYNDTCDKIDGITIPLRFERMIINLTTHEQTCFSYLHDNNLDITDPLHYGVDKLSDIEIKWLPK